MKFRCQLSFKGNLFRTPECVVVVVVVQGYGLSIDWWALGVLLFEMTAGYPPFYSTSPIRTYEKIVDGKV